MSTKIIIAVLALLAVSSAFGKFLNDPTKAHYAVLVAGSNGFWNYRHQSDIFHAYHLLVKNGVSKDNIIVLAFDDIARDGQNPFPGKVFNHPDPTGPGVDVYEGVRIDYKGGDVNPQVFLDILEGNTEAVKGKGTGRVLTSTAEDNVFINFSDHGATGLIAFPSGELYADQLIKTLKKMNEKKMYKKLVFYLEACESGSMFNEVLPKDINIFALSAASPYESSWATYCGNDAVINGVNLGSCLGDEFSVNWMEDSDKQTEKESLKAQFEEVKGKTKGSQVMEWGDLHYVDEAVTDFQGVTDSENEVDFTRLIKKIMNKFTSTKTSSNQKYLDLAKNSRMPSRDVKLDYLMRQAANGNTTELSNELQHRRATDAIFMNFATKLELSLLQETNSSINFECVRTNVDFYKLTCTNFDEYTLKYVQYIHAACKKFTTEKVSEAIAESCN